MKSPIHLKTVEIPKDKEYYSPTTYDNIEFSNNNSIEDHDLEDDFKNKMSIEKMLYYISTDDDDDEHGNWNGPTRYQLFVARCEKFIPFCITDAKVLKIAKAQLKNSTAQYVVIDIRVLDVGAFSAPVNLKVIRNNTKNIDIIVQTVIRHFIKGVEIKRKTILEKAARAVKQAETMEGPADEESIISRAINILINKKKR